MAEALNWQIETGSDFLWRGADPLYARRGYECFRAGYIDIGGGGVFDVDVPVKMAGRELKTGLQKA